MKNGIVLLITGIVLSGIAHADTLASWDFYDVNIGAVASVAADTTVLDTASAAAGTPQANSTGKGIYKTREVDDADLASAITSGAGFTLSFTAQDGEIMDLTQLKVLLDRDGSSGPSNAAILFDADADGFDSDDSIWTSAITDNIGVTATIDLSALGAAYEGLSTATFRVVPWGAAGVYNSLFLGNNANLTPNTNLDPVVDLQGTLDSVAQGGTLIQLK